MRERIKDKEKDVGIERLNWEKWKEMDRIGKEEDAEINDRIDRHSKM